MALDYGYEGSSESAVRHWESPFARLEYATPTEVGKPAAVISRTAGTQLTGTILSLDQDADIAVIDHTCSMVYRHSIRNVLTYAAGPDGAEATFGAINHGDPVYYDNSTTMVALGLFLSTSPLDNDGTANPLFGFVVMNVGRGETAASFPKGGATASTQTSDVMQVGAGR